MRQPVDFKAKAHIFKNTAFVLRHSFKCSPWSLILLFTSYIAQNVYYNVVFSVMFLETAISIIENHGSFKEFVIKISIIILGKVILDIFCDIVDFYVVETLHIKVAAYFNNMIFTKANQVELGCYENPDFFDNYNRATWVVEKGGYQRILNGTAWMLGSLASIVSLAIYLFNIDPWLLLVLICPIVVMLIGRKRNNVEFESEKARTPFERQKDYTKRTVLLKDFAKEIKTTNIFDVIKKRYKNAVEQNMKLIKKYGIKIALLEIVSDLFGEVVPVAGGFAYGCFRLMVLQNIEISQFSVLISAITNCRNRLNNLAWYLTMMQKNCLWVQSFREFMEYEPKIVGGDKTPDDFQSIEFKNVSFHYPGNDINSLNNVSFKINKGESVAVVGHNGAGKTTLSKLMMRLYDADEGEILYNGVNIKEYDLLKYRKKFASVFQDYRIFAMTVAENVLVDETDEKNLPLAKKALQQSGVYSKIETLPQKENTLLTREFDDEGALLSGGESQKITIARMLAKKFDIAILDEPSSALDPVAESKMYDNLMQGTKGKTVIYISHRLSSAARSDNILVFANGELIEQGSHDELMALSGEYCNMFTLQASGYNEEVQEDEA